ncbi:Uncharacterized protein QTN25_009945 [Entamoeba marina]
MSTLSQQQFDEYQAEAQLLIKQKVIKFNALIIKNDRFKNLKSQLTDLRDQLVNYAKFPSNATERQLRERLQFLDRVVKNMSTKRIEKGFIKHEGKRYKLEQFNTPTKSFFGHV